MLMRRIICGIYFSHIFITHLKGLLQYLFMFDSMRINIKWKIVFVAMFLFTAGLVQKSIAQEEFKKSTFYDTMASGDLAAVENQLTILQGSSIANKEGYEGDMLIRKAGLVKGAKTRLDLFKAGRIKLETAIAADNENTEFHFLRLAIEEHAPKIVKYHNDIEKDKTIVQKNFKSLSPSVQHAILDYSKNSKVLHAEDL